MRQGSGESRQTEHALVRRVVAGDLLARDEFARRYRPVVERLIAGAGILPEQEHDDLCQTVFVHLLDDGCRRLRAYRGTARLSTWLRVVALRLCLDHVRRLVSEGQHLRQAGDHLDDKVAHDITSGLRIAVRDALAKLGPPDQLVVRLFYEHELTYTEIAEAIGMPVNTVASRLHRARGRLRAMLREAGVE